jgi:16S rRNA (guanine527-N7)-methyltransferase
MELIRKYFPDLDDQQMGKLIRFREEILKWNQRLNLVSRKDSPYLEERHILHSLGIALFFSFPDSCKILDVGTGGGFPGIPLAIVYPGARFTLVDSIAKKIGAVREITATLNLSNVDTRQVRAEMLEEKFHFIVSRAVTSLSRFTGWMKDNILDPSVEFPDNGILYLKGGDLGVELRPFPGARIYTLGERFSEPFFETKKLIYLPFEGLKKNTTFAV